MTHLSDVQPDPSFARRYDLDWLRVIAFLCLIFYHVGMFYVTWGWHVKSVYVSPALQPYMSLMNPWRLGLLFFISGVAFRFVSDKVSRAETARQRLIRLGVPLVFGIVVIVAPQSYFQLLESGEIQPGFLRFWPHYLDLRQQYSIITPTYNHLWYVAYLLAYSLLVLPVLPWLRRAGEPVMRAVAGSPWTLLALPALPFVGYELTLSQHFPNTNVIWDDWANHAHRFSIFLMGYWAAKSPAFWRSVARGWKAAPPLAAVLGAVFFFGTWVGPAQRIEALHALDMRMGPAAHVYYAWFCILTLLGAAQTWLNRPGRALSYLTRAVYPYFIAHQTIIVVFGYWLTRQDVPAVPEFLLVCAATAAGCAALYEIVRRIPPLRPLFGLKLHASAPASRQDPCAPPKTLRKFRWSPRRP